MAQLSEKDLVALAEQIYNLDGKIYELLGSSLGRVFNTGKERSIKEMLRVMQGGKGYVLRNEMALISNMAHTIPDKETKRAIFKEYEELLQKLQELPTNQMTVDILDKERARLNQIQLKHRFDEEDNFVICIERTYGCGGTGIGFALADKLGINYYDAEIFQDVMQRFEAGQNGGVGDPGAFSYNYDLNKDDSKKGGKYFYTMPVMQKKHSITQKLSDFKRYHGLTKRDAIYFTQSQFLCQLAKKEDFVMMGHCADIILTRHHIPHVSILITAPLELRVKRILQINPNMTEKEVRLLIHQQDSQYARYYKFFTDLKWEDPSHYDISINSATYGVQGSVDMIYRILTRNLEQN